MVSQRRRLLDHLKGKNLTATARSSPLNLRASPQPQLEPRAASRVALNILTATRLPNGQNSGVCASTARGARPATLLSFSHARRLDMCFAR
jgi:hypothetical protein